MIEGVPRRVSSPVFVGRAAELERLTDALERARAGHAPLVLVAGEAGVGKSRLVGELIGRAAASGATALVGACLDTGEGGLPFAPFSEALRGLARVLGPEATADLVGPAAGPLARLTPDLGPPMGVVDGDADPAGRQSRLFDSVLGVLGRLADERPVILVLEDLHWADGSTRDLVRFLVRNLREERLLLVGTYRSDELHRRHPLMPLLSELGRSERVERLELPRFGREELRAQLAGITGATPSEALVDAILERSDGIPFYVEELVEGDPDPGRAMPTSLREILGLRLASLPDHATAIVRAAAVVGVRVPLDRLAAVVGLDGAKLDAGLRAAAEAGILVPGASVDPSGPAIFAFRHALLQEAAYDELLPTEQVRLHGRLADHLADRLASGASGDPAVVADFAVHAYHARDQQRALAGSVRAMRLLADAGAYREALGHAERALELWPRIVEPGAHAGIDHVDLLAFAARMAGNTGRPERAVGLGQEALRELGSLVDPEREASLLADLLAAALEAWDLDAMDSAAERAPGVIEGLAASRPKLLVLDVYGYVQGFRGRDRSAVRAHEEALAIARSIGDARAVSTVAPMLASQLAVQNRAGRAEAVLEDTAPTADLYDSTPWPYWAAVERHMALWWLGRFHDAIAVIEAAIPMASRYGLHRRVMHWLTPTDPLFELGRIDEAAELETRATAAIGGHVALGQGRVATSRDIIRGEFDRARLGITARRDYSAWARMGTLRLTGKLARAEGDLPTVRAAVDEGLEIAAGAEMDGPLLHLLGDAIGAAADATVTARHRRRAEDLANAQADGRRWIQRLRALVDEARSDGGAGEFCEATLVTAEAELGRLEGEMDPVAWATAIDRWAGMSHVQWTAYARLRLAEAMLDTGGDRHGAEAALRDARDGAAALGARPLLEAIETVGRHARIDLVPGTTRGASEAGGRPSGSVPHLTGRERDVLGLVAQGHTNREIGDRLFISEKTVSVHVSNAMAKLGALSRYEAAATAERLGLLFDPGAG
jgi:DNA-binding CsgD family transcriptional regulator/tetratricopeptide (TPR) repeat protein